MSQWLDKINGPEDIRDLDLEASRGLAEEIRAFLLDKLSRTGGHLSSNLGVVELTIALHQCFDAPRDKIIFDVGHQSYVHKILTGRKDQFDGLRQKDGLSGFPKTEESPYDVADTGHATTSISQAYGMAKARDLLQEDYQVVCVIGDGSMTGGMAYEAMNNVGRDKTNLIIVLNDNEMSISHSVGGLSTHLGKLRTGRSYLSSKQKMKKRLAEHPNFKRVYDASANLKNKIKYLVTEGILFEELGITYLGPVDGHDIEQLREAFQQAKTLKEPVLVHVITRKGKGYLPAETEPEKYHSVGRFDVSTGALEAHNELTYADVFGAAMEKLCREDSRLALVTAAMKMGTGLSRCGNVKERIFDVGIAEEHAVTFAAGLARGGMKPVVAIYSTFLQRAYDQILHDVCIPKLPVIFAMDHSGVVGDDGETHQGVFDIAYLSHIPGMCIMAPSCKEELERMLEYAVTMNRPVAIRYPKGKALSLPAPNQPLTVGKGTWVRKAKVPMEGKRRIAILSLGTCLEEALKAAEAFKEKALISVADLRFAMPLDEELIQDAFAQNDLVITLEDHVHMGGMGMHVEALAKENQWNTACVSLSLPDEFLKQDTRVHTLQACGLTADGIVSAINKRWNQEGDKR